MQQRDRQLLAGLAEVNREIGAVTLQLLTLQAHEESYAAGLRLLGRDLMRIGAQLIVRADELDGRTTSPELLTAAEGPDTPP